jgi:branched-subunit amino acid transport protein AzlD
MGATLARIFPNNIIILHTLYCIHSTDSFPSAKESIKKLIAKALVAGGEHAKLQGTMRCVNQSLAKV